MKQNIALVLSGGGARGYAHIGVIKSLEKNFTITSIAGTSMGALVGGIYSSGGLSEFEKWIDSLDKMEVLKLTDFTFSKKGLVKGVKIINKIKEIVPDRNIEDLKIPYCAVATDVINRKEVVFSSGSLYDAIRASISIPTVFQPININKCCFVDGGIINPLPINRVKRHKGDILVVVDVNSPIPYVKKKVEPIQSKKYLRKVKSVEEKIINLEENVSILSLSSRSINIMIQKITQLTIEQYKPDILISVSEDSYSIFDFHRAKEIIEEGERVSEITLREFIH
jgi:NTE family protein